MTRPVRRRQAIYPSFTSVVTRYWSLLGVPSTRVVRNPLTVQANDRTESNRIIESLAHHLQRLNTRADVGNSSVQLKPVSDSASNISVLDLNDNES